MLLGVVQLTGNQFGFDRDGFRVFVLCAAPRRDILLGKNLAFAPLALGMAAILLAAVQVVLPHAAGPLPGHASRSSLDVPAVLHAHEPALDLRAVGHRRGLAEAVEPEVEHGSCSSWRCFPRVSALSGPDPLPAGDRSALAIPGLGAARPGLPVLSLAECAVVLVLYRFALNGLGRLLQAREQMILETVTNRAA